MSSKSKKSPAQKPTVVRKLRWSIGVFTSAHDGEPVVCYCTKDGVISPSYAKMVKGKKASHHMVYFGMTYAKARAALLKHAGVKLTTKKAAKKTSAKEAVRRAA